MDNRCDVIIVGASLAGSSAAIQLGKSGLKVALVDRAVFPRRKPCGEGLSPLGLLQLERLGIREQILKLPHIPYTGYNVFVGDSCKFIRSPIGGGITLQRFDFDDAVLRRALEFPSVSALLSNNVERVDGGVVHLRDRSISARKVVIACGGNSPLLGKVGHQTKRSGPNRTGVSALYRGHFLGHVNWITIILKSTFEIYCTPLAEGYLNVSVLKRSDASINIHSIFNDISTMREVFDKCSFEGVLTGSPQGRTNIGNVRRQSDMPAVVLAGDALEEFDPIGGMGMSHALSSGIQVAHQITRELCEDFGFRGEARPLLEYAQSMRRFTRTSYWALMGSKYFPPLLSLSASKAGEYCARKLLGNCI